MFADGFKDGIYLGAGFLRLTGGLSCVLDAGLGACHCPGLECGRRLRSDDVLANSVSGNGAEHLEGVLEL